jgi:hypothetical protein
MTWKNREAWISFFHSNIKAPLEINMNKNKELKAALILWEKLCELEKLLFDHYGDEFFELHLENHKDTAKSDGKVDWPF